MKKLCLLILASGVLTYSFNASAQSEWTPKKTKKKSSKSKIKIDSTKAKSSSQKSSPTQVLSPGDQVQKEFEGLTKAEKAEYRRRMGKMVWVAKSNRDIKDKPTLNSVVKFESIPAKFLPAGAITKSNFSKYKNRKICVQTQQFAIIMANTLCAKKAKKRQKRRKRN